MQLVTGQIPCKRLTSQPILAHDWSLCPFIKSLADPNFFLTLFLFFPSFFSLLHFFFPLLFFCPPLISSSPFPLPSFLFSFSYSFPIPFLSFLLLVSFFSSPFCFFSFSLSSLYFILLISSSFSPPLSHCFCFCFFFLALKFLSCFTSLPRGLL